METFNRAKRAVRLLETLRLDMAAAYGEDADVYAVAAAVHDMSPEDFNTLAERVKINPPSEDTIVYIQAFAGVLVECLEFVEANPVSEFTS
jgi:hypothetical protein